MSLFSKQPMRCNNCGTELETNFQDWDGRFCSRYCNDEYRRKRVLALMGKPYEPRRAESEGRDDE